MEVFRVIAGHIELRCVPSSAGAPAAGREVPAAGACGRGWDSRTGSI